MKTVHDINISDRAVLAHQHHHFQPAELNINTIEHEMHIY